MAKGPIAIAYDGSPAAKAAVVRAAELFAPAQALIITVWEPGLGEMMLMPDPTGLGTATLPYDPSTAREIDEEVERRALAVAREGVALAERGGLRARDLVVEDVNDVARAIVSAADEHAAAAIVIGAVRHSKLRSKLLGSTSASVMNGAGARPVLLVHAPPSREA